jgi:hypothetical protein
MPARRALHRTHAARVKPNRFADEVAVVPAPARSTTRIGERASLRRYHE